ncbi:amidohydrolase family protein [Sphingosinicella microcystinivorans]|uniref:Imidazolonepropionase-like amidohydrolase n=1 Tax=Sphingosinicella microcystinivorans TaxID=335406 RepID=A0AAD1D5I5_SPHMI|nr:amidohydrolase family protein [Sphingosinicella microcystinivorans]RKS91240.1 imidazolonepropionase-like amidohydrolase [Sphingosinicella microcystinivorans]BBE34208.1 Xaa-Pro dipeptidase [Sphingosinicella microcystinivorans]
MTMLITGATILDAVSDKPIEGQAILIEGKRIKAIGRRDELPVPADATVIDATGKYVIPGLMNANVHLLCDIRPETLLRYEGRYEDLIAESAQVALKSGQTTVFDTWGPRRALMATRDAINDGKVIGSRVFCAGNVIGFDGPYSPDFGATHATVLSTRFVNRINATWVENTGRHLMWLTPKQVAEELRTYIEKGIDFIKYAANEHGAQSLGAFISFSERVQRTIVDEAHRAGITAQSHAMSVEGLHMSVMAGCDLITHCNITGPTEIPDETIELMVKQDCGAVIFPWSEKGLQWMRDNMDDGTWTTVKSTDNNARNLIKAGARIMLANDGAILPKDLLAEPAISKGWVGAPEEMNFGLLATGHFVWLEAMEEKCLAPMEMLRAATRNIAVAYKKDADLGTLEAGKFADLVILDKNPLESAKNYRAIGRVVKEGAVVDIDALPLNRILTRELDPAAPEEADYKHFAHKGQRFPMCTACAIVAH